MPRLSKTQVFEKSLKGMVGKNQTSTYKGMIAYDNPSVLGPFGAASQLPPGVIRPDYQIRFEIPTRDHIMAYLSQEMLAVCQKAGTLIRLSDGSEKAIEDFTTSDRVLTAEGNVRAVLKTMRRLHTGSMTRIKLWGHQHLECTSEHPILTKRGYIEAGNLREDDWIALPKFMPELVNIISPYDYLPKGYRGKAVAAGSERVYSPQWTKAAATVAISPMPREVALDKRFGRVIGLFLAEGHSGSSRVEWTFNINETDTLVAELVGSLNSLGIVTHMHQRQGNNSATVSIYGVGWASFFTEMCGKYAIGKRLHPVLCSGPKEFLEGVFSGWMDGDGHTDSKKGIQSGVSISKRLAMGMYNIAQALGMKPSIRLQRPCHNTYAKTRHPSWLVAVSTTSPDRQKELRSKQTETHVWRLVRKIETRQLEHPIDVYNLEVEGDNSYVAEGIGVHNCSRLKRGLDRLASDASQDSTAGSQPFTILVNESLPSQREKILIECQKVIKRTKLGLHGRMRLIRALATGDAIGQPVYEEDSHGRWHLNHVMIMPTWEMHYDHRTGIWRQFKAGRADGHAIAIWEIPDFMARVIHDEDDNYPYGRTILSTQVVNYRQYIMSLEDLSIASRTRAPRRLVHYVGPEAGGWKLDSEAIRRYKERNESRPKTIITDYYISKGFEEVKELHGDAAGLKALLEVVHYNELRMLQDMGLPQDLSDLAGRHVSESADAAYAARINQLRQEDTPFVIDILEKALKLEGFAEIDIDVSIPPLGETESIRWKRLIDAYNNSIISYDTLCAGLGLKDPVSERNKVTADISWKMAHEIPVSNLPSIPAPGDQPSESADQGGDSKMGEERRFQQKRTGKENPSGV